ncbi:SUMF1/EgtB/PvdO family nonheme iron enzyme [Thermodesulfobacteriota bacterium]
MTGERDEKKNVSEPDDRTVALNDDDATMMLSEDDKRAQQVEEMTVFIDGTSTSGEQVPVKSGTILSASRKIREVLMIDSVVDLEKTSHTYFSGRQRTSRDHSSFVSDLIARAGSERKYIFSQEIGRGGMGAVFETVDQDICRKVAMKVLLPGKEKETFFVRQFLEEAQIAGQLEHPNIVPVHEIGLDEKSNIYFTMKLVKGEDLNSILAKLADGDQAYQSRYGLGTLIQIFMKVCDGMGYAHSQGVLHRDLKPQNIMVGEFGEVMIMDWGVAKILGRDGEKVSTDSTAEPEGVVREPADDGMIVGTPSYMSPEQAAGQTMLLDERSDVFSLGAILYKILTGKNLYEGKMSEQLEQARQARPVPPSLKAPEKEIPAELSAICEKAMSPEMDSRYDGAVAVKKDLQLFLDGKSVSAKKDALFTRCRKWIIRNKVATAGIVAAVLCLAGGIVANSIYNEQQKSVNITALLEKAEQAGVAEDFEAAEESFFAVLGLDHDNGPARQGIARVSGKALAVKNRRLAVTKLHEAEQAFTDRQFARAYDLYVATLTLDPDSAGAKEKIMASAVGAEKAKIRNRIRPLLDDAQLLGRRQQEVDRELLDLTVRVKELQGNIKGFEDFPVKKPLWQAEQSLLDKRIDLLQLEGKILSKYSMVLSHDGENSQARNELAGIYFRKFLKAESLRQHEEMAYYRELLLTFDDGLYQKKLAQPGSIVFNTEPAADSYSLYHFQEGPDRRLVPVPFVPTVSLTPGDFTLRDSTGILPGFKPASTSVVPLRKLLVVAGTGPNRFTNGERLVLPAGSYLIVARKGDFLETRIPFMIQRGAEKVHDPVQLLRTKKVPSGFVYVPGGEFIRGGDSQAPYSVERQVTSIPGFLIQQHEVTVGEYLKFINDMERRLPGSAEKYLPRRAVSSGFYWEKTGNRYESSFPDNWPILGVSLNDAKAFCKWLSLQHKDKQWRFRLPDEQEWEKASRGVDGRVYPWGNYFDFRFCSMANSHADSRTGPDPVGAYELDESVFGLMDTAGNVSEWCHSYFDQAKNIMINKGSAWSFVDPGFARSAGRNGQSPAAVSDSRGFRIAMSVGGGES